MTSIGDQMNTLPSVFDIRPSEEGGPIARIGFDYQDEFAVVLLIDMMADATIRSVLCETHDDLIVLRDGPNGTIAEFIQVKGEEPFQYWSVAMLCQGSTSIFEKSLGHDRFSEESRFRLVTHAPVNKDLTVLCKSIADRNTPENIAQLNELTNMITSYVGDYRSQKGNDVEFWLRHCLCDVRRDRRTLFHANLNALMELAERERRSPNYVQLSEFRLVLLDWVRTASAARWNTDRAGKIITREALRSRWEQFAALRAQHYGPHQRIVAFQKSYLRSDLGDVPFGGRDATLEELTSWLVSEEEARRGVLVAPSGRGKSALLVHWFMRLQETPATREWRSIFMPISMRYGTNLPAVFYQGIALQLAELLGETIPPPAIDASVYYADVCTALLGRVELAPFKILIVVDGIDEALDQSFSGLIFPSPLPPNLKVLLSARELANDSGATGCLTRLGWRDVRSVRSFDIPLLSEGDIKELLERFSLLPESIDDSREVVRSIHHLTEGEPLLAMLYVDDLRRAVLASGQYDPEVLKGLRPGFTAFIEDWITDQRKAWRHENQHFDDRILDATLSVLSCAFGPLSGPALVQLVASVSGTAPVLSTQTLIHPIERFVTGDGSLAKGYVFSHPKLGQYFQESHLLEDTKSRTHTTFAAWGRETVEQLNGGQRPPGEVDPYLLQHYFRHLECSGASLQDFCAILSRPWQEAWDRFEGGYRGFSVNIRMVLNHIGPLAQYLPSVQPYLLARLEASLCMGTVKAFGTTLPIELMSLALEDGVITLQQALHHIELQDPANQLSGYFMILPHLSREHAMSVVADLAATPDAINPAHWALCALPRVEGELKDRLDAIISQALETPAISLPHVSYLLDWLPYRNMQHIDAVIAMLAMCSIMPDSEEMLARQYAKLIRLVVQYRPDLVPGLRAQCSSHLLRGRRLVSVISVIQEYSDVIPPETIQQIIEASKNDVRIQYEALMAKQSSGNCDTLEWIELGNTGRVHMALEILDRLQDGRIDGLVEHIVAQVNLIQDPYNRAQAFNENILLFPSQCKETAIEHGFQLARSLVTGNNRTHALLSLAKKVDAPIRAKIVREGLQHAIFIEDGYAQAHALISLFGNLSPEGKAFLKEDVLHSVMQVFDYIRRGELLVDLSSHLMGGDRLQLCAAGLHMINSYGISEFRSGALINALPKLPTMPREATFRQCLQSSLAAAHQPNQPTFWLNAQLLAEKVPDLWRESDVLQVYALSSGVVNSQSKAQFLAALAPLGRKFGQDHIVRAAFDAALQVEEIFARARYLVQAYQVLDGDPALATDIMAFLGVVRAAPDDAAKARALVTLFPYLPITLRSVVIDEAIRAAEHSDPRERDHVLLFVSSIVDDVSRKIDLIAHAWEAANALPFDSRLTALTRLPPHLTTRAARLEVLDIITGGGSIARTNLLMSWVAMGPVLLEFGGEELVMATMRKIAAVCRTWP